MHDPRRPSRPVEPMSTADLAVLACQQTARFDFHAAREGLKGDAAVPPQFAHDLMFVGLHSTACD